MAIKRRIVLNVEDINRIEEPEPKPEPKKPIETIDNGRRTLLDANFNLVPSTGPSRIEELILHVDHPGYPNRMATSSDICRFSASNTETIAGVKFHALQIDRDPSLRGRLDQICALIDRGIISINEARAMAVKAKTDTMPSTKSWFDI